MGIPTDDMRPRIKYAIKEGQKNATQMQQDTTKRNGEMWAGHIHRDHKYIFTFVNLLRHITFIPWNPCKMFCYDADGDIGTECISIFVAFFFPFCCTFYSSSHNIILSSVRFLICCLPTYQPISLPVYLPIRHLPIYTDSSYRTICYLPPCL